MSAMPGTSSGGMSQYGATSDGGYAGRRVLRITCLVRGTVIAALMAPIKKIEMGPLVFLSHCVSMCLIEKWTTADRPAKGFLLRRWREWTPRRRGLAMAHTIERALGSVLLPRNATLITRHLSS
jgi:hypothetical protein